MKPITPLLLIVALACSTGCGEAPLEESPAPTAASDSKPLAATDALSEQRKVEYQQQIEHDQRAIAEATVAGDGATVQKFTHPRLIEFAGGEEKFAQIIEQGIEGIKATGLTFSDVTFPAPPHFIQTPDRVYAVITPSISISMQGKTVETSGVQLGVLENGSTQWTYIDVGKLDRATIGQWLPDFPADYELPAASVREL